MSTESPSTVDILRRVIAGRRSIKPSEFREDPIPDDMIHDMLNNANWAPTHGMTEPWRFFVFCGDARRRLGEFLADVYDGMTPPELRKPAKGDQLISNACRSSHVIAIAMRRQVSEKIPELEEIEAVACAVQNLHLTATAYGIGGYWSSGAAICSSAFRDHLGLGEKDRVLGLFYLGYPANGWPQGSRTPFKDKVTWLHE
ncbi:MAG: nitroreductase [Planctomycetaceae bacterium]